MKDRFSGCWVVGWWGRGRCGHKRAAGISLGVGTVRSLYCGVGYVELHRRWNCVELHGHMKKWVQVKLGNLNKSSGLYKCHCPMQWQSSMVLQNVFTGGSWDQCTKGLSVLFLAPACKSTVISIIIWINKIEPGLLFFHLIFAVSYLPGVDFC